MASVQNVGSSVSRSCEREADFIATDVSRSTRRIPLCGKCAQPFQNNPKWTLELTEARQAAREAVVRQLRAAGATEEQLHAAGLV
jgi:hypothetical protein